MPFSGKSATDVRFGSFAANGHSDECNSYLVIRFHGVSDSRAQPSAPPP